MDVRDAIVSCLKQHATFAGRARRSEFWYPHLFTVTVIIVTASLDGAVLGTSSDDPSPLDAPASLALLVPSPAVGRRRMHDTDRHGARYLIGLIPLVGWVLVIVWGAEDSQPAPTAPGPHRRAAPGTASP